PVVDAPVVDAARPPSAPEPIDDVSLRSTKLEQAHAKIGTSANQRDADGVFNEASSVAAAASALGRSEIGPLDPAVGHAPARVGEALDVDELVGVAPVLGAAAAAVLIAALVVHRDDDRLRARFQAEVVQVQFAPIGEH